MATAAGGLRGAGAEASAVGGLVVPTEAVAARVESILSHGRVLRPSLGMHLGPDGLAERLGSPADGPVVMEVLRGGPAHMAGVRAGDVIMALDARPTRRVQTV